MIFNRHKRSLITRTGLITALVLAVGGLAPARVEARDPEAAQAAYRTAIAYERASNLRAARVEMANAIEADPNWPDARLAQARILIALGEGVSAEAEMRRARDIGLSADSTRTLIAHAILLQGEPVRALAELQGGPIPERYRGYAERVAGNAHLALGNFGAARAAFDLAIRYDRNNSQLWADIARFRYANSDLGGAIDAIEFSLKLNRNNMDAMLIKAGLIRENQGLVPALVWYERVLKAKPEHVGALTEYAATLGDAGRYTDMLKVTRRILALDKNNPRAYLLQATMAARAERFDLANRLLVRIEKPLGDLPAYLLLSAVVEGELGNHNIALNQATRLLDMQPYNVTARRVAALASLNAGDSEDAWHWISPITAHDDADSWSLMTAASTLMAEDQWGEAIPLMQRAGSYHKTDALLFPLNGDAETLASAAARNQQGAQVVIAYIRAEISQARPGNALAAAQRLQQQNPGVPDAHLLVGDTELANKRPAAAAKAYQQAVNLRFNEASALRLADAQTQSGDIQSAQRTLTNFMVRSPESVPAMRILGAFYLKQRDWTRAVTALEMVRARTGNRDALLMNELGLAWQGKGNLTNANIYFRHAYDIQPMNPAISYNLGWGLYRAGGHQETAVELLEKAVVLAPQTAVYQQRLEQARSRTS